MKNVSTDSMPAANLYNWNKSLSNCGNTLLSWKFVQITWRKISHFGLKIFRALAYWVMSRIIVTPLTRKFGKSSAITMTSQNPKFFACAFYFFFRNKLSVPYFSTNLENTKKVDPIDPKGQDSFNITSNLYKRIISVLAIWFFRFFKFE